APPGIGARAGSAALESRAPAYGSLRPAPPTRLTAAAGIAHSRPGAGAGPPDAGWCVPLYSQSPGACSPSGRGPDLIDGLATGRRAAPRGRDAAPPHRATEDRDDGAPGFVLGSPPRSARAGRAVCGRVATFDPGHARGHRASIRCPRRRAVDSPLAAP